MKNLHFFLLGIAFSLLLLLASILLNYAAPKYQENNPMDELAETIFERSTKDSTKIAAIYDKGLQMLRGTYVIPEDWLLQQNIHTSSWYGSLQQLMLSFKGVNGELIRVEQHPGSYPIGKAEDHEDFRDELEKIYQQGLRGILDEYQLQKTTAGKPSGISYLDSYVRTDSLYQYLETHLTGQRDGKAYEGIIRLVYFAYGEEQSASVHTYLTLSPEGKLAQTLQTEETIAYSYEANPAFEQYLLQINKYYREYVDRYTQPYDYYRNSFNRHKEIMKSFSQIEIN
jgi:hypothetical protein